MVLTALNTVSVLEPIISASENRKTKNLVDCLTVFIRQIFVTFTIHYYFFSMSSCICDSFFMFGHTLCSTCTYIPDCIFLALMKAYLKPLMGHCLQI